jgi:hypothetical protein
MSNEAPDKLCVTRKGNRELGRDRVYHFHIVGDDNIDGGKLLYACIAGMPREHNFSSWNVLMSSVI